MCTLLLSSNGMCSCFVLLWFPAMAWLMRRTMSWTENLLGAWVEVEPARSTQRAASDACPRQTNLSCPQWKLRKTFRLSTILVFIFMLRDCNELNDSKIIVFQGFAKMNIGRDWVESLETCVTRRPSQCNEWFGTIGGSKLEQCQINNGNLFSLIITIILWWHHKVSRQGFLYQNLDRLDLCGLVLK